MGKPEPKGLTDAERLEILDIVGDFVVERERQIVACRHGGDTRAFDTKNTQNDWVAYITAYLGRASAKCHRNEQENQDFRTNLIKVAALAIAAIQARNKGLC